ncbi:MAG: IS110 family transposase [Pseudomonadota bacterium]
MATLNAADVLARVSRPTPKERLARTPVVIRDGLVQCRAKLMNTVRSVLDAEGIEVASSTADGFTGKACSILDETPKELAEAVTPILEAIDALSEQIATCDEAIELSVKSDPVTLRLMTAPGVGPIVASYFATTVRDPSRFKSGRQVGAYLGLVPSLYASGQTSRKGRITKHGSRKARWALTVAANAVLRTRSPSRLRDWYWSSAWAARRPSSPSRASWQVCCGRCGSERSRSSPCTAWRDDGDCRSPRSPR